MEPQPTKSMVMPIAITVLLSAIIFGGLGYYLAGSQPETDTSTVVTTPSPKTTTTATSTPMDKSDWKTFTSTSLKFSVQYPPTWGLIDNTEGATTETNPVQTLNLAGPGGIPPVTIWVNPAGHGVPIPEIQYTIEYKNGKVVFGDRQVNVTQPTDELQAQKGNIQFTGELNGNKFYIMATKVNDVATENLLKDIISTYKKL